MLLVLPGHSLPATTQKETMNGPNKEVSSALRDAWLMNYPDQLPTSAQSVYYVCTHCVPT